MNNLAAAYTDAGRTQEALKLYEETVRLKKAKLGPDHPDTLLSMGNLANSYHDAGRTEEALKLLEETLRLRKAKLGSDHPDTLNSANSLAAAYAQAGRTEEALKLFEETLRLRKAKLGPDHPDTLASMNNLAFASADAGRTQEALKLYKETLRLQKAKLGPDHPERLRSMNNLASCYICVGEVAKAVEILQESLALRELRAKTEPGNSAEQANLAWTHGLIAHAEQARLDYAAAVQAYARAVAMYDKLDQAGALTIPADRKMMDFYRQQLALCRKAEQAVKDLEFVLKQPAAEVPGLLDLRVRFLLKEEKLPAAIDTAAKAKQLAGDEAGNIYDAACAYALCAAAAKQAKWPVAEIPGAQQLADTAMALLKQAVAKGFKDAAHMKQDNDLDGLRERDDFKQLLADVESANEKK
jgi:pentatricopeptide repeat protein